MKNNTRHYALAGFLSITILLLWLWYNSTAQYTSEGVNRTVPAFFSNNTVKQASTGTQTIDTINNRLASILVNAHSASNQYQILLQLLDTDEEKLLKALGERHYPSNIGTDDPRFEEIAMITRAMIEFYRYKPLYETLEKFEHMYHSGLLYNNVVADLFFATEGWENTNTAYNWIMVNPSEDAAKRSGRSIGGKLADFDTDSAWEKSLLLPEGSIRSGALSSVVSVIAANDLNKAITLMKTIAPTEDLDRAMSDLVGKSIEAGLHFENIVELAISPVDTHFRAVTMSQLFQAWASRDSAALRTWINKEHPFSADTIAEIRLMAKQALQTHSVDIVHPHKQ